MARINPDLPDVGSDAGVWGDESNAVITEIVAQGNNHDDRIVSLETNQSTSNGRLTAIEISAITKPAGGTDGQALIKSGSSLAWATVGSGGGSAGLAAVDNNDGTFTISGTNVLDNGNGTYTVTY